MQQNFNTLGIILRRTNYGEADRIINAITPQGKISAIAKSARKEKSKLAGGIEMFSLVELTVHQGRGDMGLLTGAKMIKHYSNIMKELEKVELAALFLKKVSAAAEQIDCVDYFEITKCVLGELHEGTDVRLIEGWFYLNMMRVRGEEMNLYRDAKGEKLVAEERYDWDGTEAAFVNNENGKFGVDEIKMLRVLSGANFGLVKRVKVESDLIDRAVKLVRLVEKGR